MLGQKPGKNIHLSGLGLVQTDTNSDDSAGFTGKKTVFVLFIIGNG
jgi:hypothetical protein